MKLLLFAIILGAMVFQKEDPYKSKRLNMVRTQIEARGIDNVKILTSMRKVPRHLFVPEEQQQYAYEDRPLPIGYSQTISQPYIVAYMTAEVRPGNDDTVLEIGTGSGYQAAVLSEIVDQVYSLEIIPGLGNEAKERLESLGYENVHVKVSDGYYGWKEKAPFDAIIVTAAAREIPPPIIEQLNEGGRMIIPVGPQYGAQVLILLEKKHGKIKKRTLLPVAFVPFTRD